MIDYGKSLEKLLQETYINYNGVLIERDGDKYRAFNHWYDNIFEAKDAVDQSYNHLKNSIK